jgi:hypothetical protein
VGYVLGPALNVLGEAATRAPILLLVEDALIADRMRSLLPS